jgi:hypothetical protein
MFLRCRPQSRANRPVFLSPLCWRMLLMTSIFLFVLFASAPGAQSPATAKTKQQELTTKDARLLHPESAGLVADEGVRDGSPRRAE